MLVRSQLELVTVVSFWKITKMPKVCKKLYSVFGKINMNSKI